ncbi:hypothetical protein SMD11_4891 [Streptomyces albireticuli]|uniref:Uncharacterized protein n=1 Tax=Streptomyces albireticuli TaxID=1940 RepID=A0A1Z2L849_9ACTN|nr:hypothetical protein SMD11_4891 [Streptomyces albireticuli]
MRARVPAVAPDHPHPLLDALGLRRQRLAQGGHHPGVGLQARHLMARPGQPQGLGALAGADVEDPQPAAHREAGGYLFVELACDQLLPDRVP